VTTSKDGVKRSPLSQRNARLPALVVELPDDESLAGRSKLCIKRNRDDVSRRADLLAETRLIENAERWKD